LTTIRFTDIGDQLDSIESVAVGVLVERFGRLSDARMREVCAALEIAVDCRP